MAMLRTLGESTVVICRRCTSEVRPCGCRMKMSMAGRSRQASMAAEPVSPEVAPTMVMRWPRLRQHMIVEPAEKLQRHILEGQESARGTVPSATAGHPPASGARPPCGRSRHRIPAPGARNRLRRYVRRGRATSPLRQASGNRARPARLDRAAASFPAGTARRHGQAPSAGPHQRPAMAGRLGC